jgi:hypothetical protein
MIRFCGSGCGSGEDWTYMYDADDERTWLFKNYQNTYRRTLRDLGGKVLRDYFNNDTTSTVEDYVYRDGQLLGAQITQNGVAQTTRHFSLDHLGTPRLITPSPGAGSGFYTSTPCRILDTRQTGVPLTQTNPQQVYQVSGVCGVPANAVAVAFNVTLVGATTNLLGDTVNVISAPWQFAPGPNTGLWGLGALQAGSLQFQNGLGAGGGPAELSLWDRVLSAIPIESNKYGECVRERRDAPVDALIALGSSVPKRLVPPFKVVPDDPLTSVASVAAHGIKRGFGGSELAVSVARGLRSAGKVVGRASTPPTILEGAWDWGALISCAFK